MMVTGLDVCRFLFILGGFGHMTTLYLYMRILFGVLVLIYDWFSRWCCYEESMHRYIVDKGK